MKFAPIIIIYNGMSLLGQWYFKVFSKSQKYPLTPYAINDKVKVVASPRLTQMNVSSHITYWLSSYSSLELPSSLESNWPAVCHQIIVVDLAAEISSHAHNLEIAANGIMSTTVHYLYLPLLDLQPLNDVLLQDYINLFKQIDALIQSVETRAITANNESWVEGNQVEGNQVEDNQIKDSFITLIMDEKTRYNTSCYTI